MGYIALNRTGPLFNQSGNNINGILVVLLMCGKLLNWIFNHHDASLITASVFVSPTNLSNILQVKTPKWTMDWKFHSWKATYRVSQYIWMTDYSWRIYMTIYLAYTPLPEILFLHCTISSHRNRPWYYWLLPQTQRCEIQHIVLCLSIPFYPFHFRRNPIPIFLTIIIEMKYREIGHPSFSYFNWISHAQSRSNYNSCIFLPGKKFSSAAIYCKITITWSWNPF